MAESQSVHLGQLNTIEVSGPVDFQKTVFRSKRPGNESSSSGIVEPGLA